MTTTSSTPTVPRDLDTYFSPNRPRIERELFDILRIPSVSAKSDHNADTRRAPQCISYSISAAGLASEVRPTAGHPFVPAEWRGDGPSKPTVLVYGHYNASWSEKLQLWTSPPF